VGEIDGDGEEMLGIEPEEVPLVEGEPCPTCGAELTARWLSREALYGVCDGIEQANHSPPLTRPWSVVSAERHRPEEDDDVGL
jgi:hypothetical protein